MANGVGRLVRGNELATAGDGELVELFASVHDPQAFGELVRRYGPTVWAVARRTLRDHHAAEDAFQATFLLLARKADSLRSPGSVGSWLHGVALRVAARARAAARLQPLAEEPPAPPAAALAEVEAVLHEEVAALPEKYRAPIVLCCLEGLARDEAARRLGWSLNRVKSGLEQGREKLRARLARRGVGLGAGLVSALLASPAAAVPPHLSESAAHHAGANGSPAAASLANGVERTMLLSKLKWAALAVAALVAVGAVALGPALQAVQTKADPPKVAAKAGPPKPAWEVGTEFLQHIVDGKPELALKLSDAKNPDDKVIRELRVAGLKRVKIAMILLNDSRVTLVTERAKLVRRPGVEPTDEHAVVTLERKTPAAAWVVRGSDVADGKGVFGEVDDYLEGKYAFEKARKPATKQDLPSPGAKVAADFYALAVGEKADEALKLTVPGTVSENKIGELRQTGAKPANVVAVLVNDTRVETVFARQPLAVRRDRTADAHVVLMATQSGDGWRVKDIDVRDEGELESRVELYLSGRYDKKK